MLYIDGISLNLLREELETELINRKLSKIYQYDIYSISLFFNKINLYLSINPNLPIIYIAEDKEEAPDIPMTFSLALRKYILNSILKSVKQYDYDRILVLNFEKLDELGVISNYSLIFEIMGKHTNLFLCDSDNKIIDIFKRHSLDENSIRVLFTGATYERPNLTNKISPNNVTIDYFKENIHNEKDIISNIEGFGLVSAKEVYESYDSYNKFIENIKSPTIYYEENKIKIGSFIYLNQFNHLENKKFGSINSLINYYIKSTINSNQFNSLYNILMKIAIDNKNKLIKIIKLIDKDIERSQNYNEYKVIGDILAANLYSIKTYSTSVTLYNFYTDSDINIPLDNRISLKDNLNNYYKKYNKLKRAIDFNEKRKQEILLDIEYFESIIIFIEQSTNILELKSIEEELSDGKFIKKGNQKKKKKQNDSYKKYISSDGYDIYVGRNNKENDYLTFKFSDKNDIWLHVKDMPGSHVVIKNNNISQDIPITTITEAANVAAYYSKGRENNKVEVDYTFIKYVKKPNGAKPGFTIFTNSKTLNVPPKLI
ncbi:MAG: fibronectin-binding domain-containing protein [Fusobacteria bacterium]|nr:fibronectin-binding domain-containing protein [Fusobacteriota bacterium]